MDSLDKIVPQAPQPNTDIDRDMIVDAPEAYDRADMAPWESAKDSARDPGRDPGRDDEPAKDVGGEVGRKARFSPWQIAGFVAGGVAVAAGVAAIVYMRARQSRSDVQLQKLGHEARLDRRDLSRPVLGYADQIRSGIERSRDHIARTPIVKSAREKVSAFFH